MLYELEVLEARRIAELAAEAHTVRGRLLQKVRAAELGEPKPARGEHDPVGTIVLDDLLAAAPEFRRLRDAVTELPGDIRRKLWVLMAIGRGDCAAKGWQRAMAQTEAMPDGEVIAGLVTEPYLHDYLAKALYEMAPGKPTPAG
jgi:hypothetical protein